MVLFTPAGGAGTGEARRISGAFWATASTNRSRWRRWRLASEHPRAPIAGRLRQAASNAETSDPFDKRNLWPTLRFTI
jgi:hypothetical protein